MEKKFNFPNIACPLHEDQTILKIDPSVNAKQVLYCIECVLESNNLKELPSSLLTLDKFINTAALHYSASCFSPGETKSDPPLEFLDVLSSKGENLSKLEKNIDHGKKVIENIFKDLTDVIIEKINLKKKEYLQILDEQKASACNKYTFFEKQLKRTFPKQEDLLFLNPSKDELKTRLTKINTFSELSTYVKGITEDMAEDKNKISEISDMTKYLTALSEAIKSVEYTKPVVEIQNLNVYTLETPIKDILTKFLADKITLKNPISPDNVYYGNYPPSSIIGSSEWSLLKEWVPNKYNFQPKLLYCGTKDGMTSDAFHSKCDNKGPTLTLMKVKFTGSSKTSIIGGFTDKDWNKPNTWIASNESFIFSLSSKVKCFISKPEYALYGANNFGPTFGGRQRPSYCRCYFQ